MDRNDITPNATYIMSNPTNSVLYVGMTFVADAIKREKQLKHWNCQWKNNLICKMNPEWNDLFDGL